MRILLTVAVWGRDYAEMFTDYSLASQLALKNIPELARRHALTYHIVTAKRDQKWLEQHPNIKILQRHARILWENFEDYGYDVRHIPSGADGEKYPLLSRLQNLAFARSFDYDVLIFNYADFIWSNGSLTHIAALMTSGIDAVLGFCLPVDWNGGKRALKAFQTKMDSGVILNLRARDSAAVAIDHLHREARLRIWDGDAFSSMPTYLIWPVASEGLIVRAYHQTIFALKVKPDDGRYRAGIPVGSLDGYFSALLAEGCNIRHIGDSDEGIVFSLYRTPIDTTLPAGDTRDQAMRKCLRLLVSEGQRSFAEEPIYIKRAQPSADLWDLEVRRSLQILQDFHWSVSPDRAAFEKTFLAFGDIAALEQRWRPHAGSGEGAVGRGPNMGIWLYRKVLAPLMVGKFGRFLKSALGGIRARAWRTRLDAWIFGSSRQP